MQSIHLPVLQRALHSSDSALASFAASLSSAREGQSHSQMQRVDSSRSLASTASPAPSTTSVSPEALTSDCFSINEISPPAPLLSLKISSNRAVLAQTSDPDASLSPNEPMLSSSPCHVASVSENDALHPPVSSSESVAVSNLDTLARVSAMFFEIEKQNVDELREAAAKEAAAVGGGKEEATTLGGTALDKSESGLLKLTISKHEWQRHLHLAQLHQPSSQQEQQQHPHASHSHSQSFSQPSSPLPRRSLQRSSSQTNLGSKLPPSAARFNNSSYLSAEAFEEYFRSANSLAEVVQRISSDHPSQ